MSDYVVIYGDIFEGVQGVVGPFNLPEQAEQFMESHNLGHFEKAVFMLESPVIPVTTTGWVKTKPPCEEYDG